MFSHFNHLLAGSSGKQSAIFLSKAWPVPITHEQNIICSKTRLGGTTLASHAWEASTTQEQTIIYRQLFAGYVVGSRPMERKKTVRRMIITIAGDQHWQLTIAGEQ